MSLNIFKSFKFLISKINVFLRYKKKKIWFALKWVFSGNEISNFTYEIKNYKEILDIVKVITNINHNELEKILKEIDPKNKEFRDFFSKYYFEDFSNKIFFGRRIVWYLLVRTLKPEIVIESGVARGLGSGLLIYALYKNKLDFGTENQFIGIDLLKIKNSYFNFKNQKFLNYNFYYKDTLLFLKEFNEKKKIIYISDAEHNYDFEKREYELIINKMSNGSIIISDNNSGSLSDFSKKNNKNILYFKEDPINTWYSGATTSISYFY